MGQRMAGYVSYLVRFWRSGTTEDRSWRVLIRDVQGEGQQSFRTLDELFVFLREELGRLDESWASTASDTAP